jgi:hypothetical protein
MLGMTAVLVPVLGRPWQAARFMDSLRASLGVEQDQVIVHAVADLDDTSSVAAWRAAGARVDVLDPTRRPPGHPWQLTGRPGSFAEKANLGYRASRLPWLALVGDDVAFWPGWLQAGQQAAQAAGADVVGLGDAPGSIGAARLTGGQHACHLLLRRRYVEALGGGWDGPGVLCHEGYWHWCVDDELVEAAKRRGRFTFAVGAVVEHLHPAWGKATIDETYALGHQRTQQDLALYAARRAQAVAP